VDSLRSRNILSSPSTFGFDGLAVLWILCVYSFSVWAGLEANWIFIGGIPVFIFAGALYTRVIDSSTKIERALFIGIAFNLLVGTIFSLWQFLFMAFNKPFPSEVWFGHFRFINEWHVLQILTAEILFLMSLRYFWQDLKLLTLGPHLARQLGLQEKKLLTFIFIAVSLSTFLVVSSFGAFSFLGLVFPLISRKIWFNRFDLKGEFLLGSIANGLSLMSVDYLCYQFPFYGAEIPVGLLATGLGALSLIFILWKSSHREFLANPKK
jgi:ABC-type Fe3+-siderophore transport system permease subunit